LPQGSKIESTKFFKNILKNLCNQLPKLPKLATNLHCLGGFFGWNFVQCMDGNTRSNQGPPKSPWVDQGLDPYGDWNFGPKK
jgi:hypothetical protein